MKNQPLFFIKSLLMILGVIILNGCLETTSYNPQNNFTIPEEELGKKAFQYYENWILDSKKNFRTTSEFTTIYPQWQSLTHIDSSNLVSVPATRKLNTFFGDKAYLRRIVFKFDSRGEVEIAGILELIGLDLEYLENNEKSLIRGYFNGN